MAEVSMSLELDASADEVWGVVGGFHGLADWLAPIADSRMEEGGMVRRLILADDGGDIVERLMTFDHEARRISYSIVNSPRPIANYIATMVVRPAGDGTEVVWSSSFEPAGASETEAVEIVRGVYRPASTA